MADLQYFGCTNCPQARPTDDFDGTGQNNQFKYVTGLDPTNPASVFVIQIAPVTNQPVWQTLTYKPIAAGRVYTLQFITDLAHGQKLIRSKLARALRFGAEHLRLSATIRDRLRLILVGLCVGLLPFRLDRR